MFIVASKKGRFDSFSLLSLCVLVCMQATDEMAGSCCVVSEQRFLNFFDDKEKMDQENMNSRHVSAFLFHGMHIGALVYLNREDKSKMYGMIKERAMRYRMYIIRGWYRKRVVSFWPVWSSSARELHEQNRHDYPKSYSIFIACRTGRIALAKPTQSWYSVFTWLKPKGDP